jgi:16S rRNA (adenine1518-N6/adenine1519-N6)-dimethyltransferase
MFAIIRASFNQRRKTLVNGLVNGKIADREEVLSALEKMELAPTIRGEALTLAQFAQLSNLLSVKSVEKSCN